MVASTTPGTAKFLGELSCTQAAIKSEISGFGVESQGISATVETVPFDSVQGMVISQVNLREFLGQGLEYVIVNGSVADNHAAIIFKASRFSKV